ncbi:helicase associated domain-containing protein [Kocuria aegyptia]
MSAPERLEQLRAFVAAHGRAPSRRTGQQEERSLGEWVAKHMNAETSPAMPCASCWTAAR